jgi:hypothetical protein
MGSKNCMTEVERNSPTSHQIHSKGSQMVVEMDKLAFMKKIQEAHDEWLSLMAEICKPRMNDPGLPGGWSVKDVIAHITWYEREMVGLLEAMALEGSDLWQLPQDERNVPIYEENRYRPLEEVLSEAEQVHEQLFEALASLPEAALSDASHFREMPSEWSPWEVIASNTYEHYHQHIPDIREWLQESKGAD